MTNHCGSRRGCNYLTHNSRCDQALLGSGLEGISSVGGGRILKIDAHSKWFFFLFLLFLLCKLLLLLHDIRQRVSGMSYSSLCSKHGAWHMDFSQIILWNYCE